MSVFAEFLRHVRVKSIKLGPVTWDILPSEKMPFPVVPEQDIALLVVTTKKAQALVPHKRSQQPQAKLETVQR
jgi:hypothetical protein